MRLLAFTTLLTALGCLAQQSTPPAARSPAVTLPAGTKVPLRLTSPLGTKTARPGDAVHADAAFPVTASNTVAIPPGTYLEGVIDQVTRRGSHAGFTMHFTHMVFTNGYTVALSAATADTRAVAHRRSLGRRLRQPGCPGWWNGPPVHPADGLSTTDARTQQGFDNWNRGRERPGRGHRGSGPRPPRRRPLSARRLEVRDGASGPALVGCGESGGCGGQPNPPVTAEYPIANTRVRRSG